MKTNFAKTNLKNSGYSESDRVVVTDLDGEKLRGEIVRLGVRSLDIKDRKGDVWEIDRGDIAAINETAGAKRSRHVAAKKATAKRTKRAATARNTGPAALTLADLEVGMKITVLDTDGEKTVGTVEKVTKTYVDIDDGSDVWQFHRADIDKITRRGGDGSGNRRNENPTTAAEKREEKARAERATSAAFKAWETRRMNAEEAQKEAKREARRSKRAAGARKTGAASKTQVARRAAAKKTATRRTAKR